MHMHLLSCVQTPSLLYTYIFILVYHLHPGAHTSSFLCTHTFTLVHRHPHSCVNTPSLSCTYIVISVYKPLNSHAHSSSFLCTHLLTLAKVSLSCISHKSSLLRFTNFFNAKLYFNQAVLIHFVCINEQG